MQKQTGGSRTGRMEKQLFLLLRLPPAGPADAPQASETRKGGNTSGTAGQCPGHRCKVLIAGRVREHRQSLCSVRKLGEAESLLTQRFLGYFFFFKPNGSRLTRLRPQTSVAINLCTGWSRLLVLTGQVA